VQTVSILDRRTQTLAISAPHSVITSEKKTLLVDWLVKWRVLDPLRFIQGNGGTDRRAFENRLNAVVRSAFNEEALRHTAHGLISDEREQAMQAVRARLADQVRALGIEIVDARIRRVDYAAETTNDIYRRMVAERNKVAGQLAAEGEAAKEQIRADADKQRAVILAEASLQAQRTKGEADAQATRIYAEAFGHDPRFAAFYRSLQAYRASFHSKSDVVVIDSGSDFFRALRGSGGGDDAAAARKR